MKITPELSARGLSLMNRPGSQIGGSRRRIAVVSLFCISIVTASAFSSGEKHESAFDSPFLGRLTEATSVRVVNNGNRRIRFESGRDLVTQYRYQGLTDQQLPGNTLPLTLTSADLDGDGIPDLICSYSTVEGGLLVVHRGNIDSIYPNSPGARERRSLGTLTEAPFVSPAIAFESPIAGDLIGAGDFDGDGHQDLVLARRGDSALYFFRGDGAGGFSIEELLDLPGSVTAMHVGDLNRADGIPDVVVGLSGPEGSRALVFESPRGAIFAEPEEIALRAPAVAFAHGEFDGHSAIDLAIASGRELLIVRGRDGLLSGEESQRESVAPATVERRKFDFELQDIVAGDFAGDSRPDIAMLSRDGVIRVLTGQKEKKNGKPRDWSLSRMKVEKLHNERLKDATRLVRARASSLPGDTLLVMEPAVGGIRILEPLKDPVLHQHSVETTREPVEFRMDGRPVAVLPMRLNSDSINDFVILRSDSTSAAIVPSGGMTFTVTNVDDSGTGSLREAILAANANPGPDTIEFNIGGGGEQTIVLVEDLAPITDAVTMDGTTQPGFGGTPIIALNCAGTTGAGLELMAGNSVVRGLVINSAPSDAGIRISINGGNAIEGNYIGLDFTGTLPFDNQGGIVIDGSGNNTIGGEATPARNVISGNEIAQVVISSSSASGNVVRGNFIGTGADGNTSVGEAFEGVIINDAPNNTIGGIISAGNVISANENGVLIESPGASGNLVQGNIIGPSSDGLVALGNNLNGVEIRNASGNTVGGTTGMLRNLLSANAESGVAILGNSATGNNIHGNLIGTNINGGVALPNSRGVLISDSAANNHVGGTAPGASNVISGNLTSGVEISGAGSNGNLVQGNVIGTEGAGMAAVPNGGDGVLISGGASGNSIGGLDLAARNLISGNILNGVLIESAASTGNLIRGNLIGSDSTGTQSVPNSFNGIRILDSGGNSVGDSVEGAGNLVSGNSLNGITIEGLTATGNLVRGNLVGTDLSGTLAMPNGSAGIELFDAPNNTVGGTAVLAGNVISGNLGSGVELFGADATGNQVEGNLIGLNISGDGPLGNSGMGVTIVGQASNNTIGGANVAAGNAIAFNAVGIAVLSGIGNALLSNSIFQNLNLGINLSDDFVTPNDPGDLDTGANNLQNFPELSLVAVAETFIVIQGVLDSTPASSFTLQFFSNLVCDPSNHGQGETLLGSAVINTGAGPTPFSVNLPVALNPDVFVTATATGVFGTSEFSECQTTEPISCLLICPENQIVLTQPESEECGVVVEYAEVEVVGDCGFVICDPPSGSVFPVGETRVTCTSELGIGCAFDVVVFDVTPPEIECLEGITVNTQPGQGMVAVQYPIPQATDPCEIVDVVCSPPPGALFPVGLTFVTCVARDPSGIEASCFFAVEVLDGEGPFIECPADIVLEIPADQTSTTVNYPSPSIRDDHPVEEITCTPPPGATFPLGTTPVNCIARDAAQNTSSCGFTVTVNGGPPGIQIVVEGDGPEIQFGSDVPVTPTPQPPSQPGPCGFFIIENTGRTILVLTFAEVVRTGADVDAGRITDPAEGGVYTLSIVRPNGVEDVVPVGQVITIGLGQQLRFCLRFTPLLPPVLSSNTNRPAPAVIPDVIRSRVSFRLATGQLATVNVTGNVDPGVQLVNPDNPGQPAIVTFVRRGSEFELIYSPFDPDLNISQAMYEILDSGGRVIETFTVDLAGPISQSSLIRGQSFSVSQRFSGAASNPQVAGCRVTVSDGTSSATGTGTIGTQSSQFSTQQTRSSIQITPDTVTLTRRNR